MTEDLINSILFYFLCATLDVLATIIVIFYGIGIEGNPVWNWITPKELMLVVCVLANLGLGIFIISIAPRISKHRVWNTAIKCGLYGEGLGRLAFGFIPGILLMKGAGWF